MRYNVLFGISLVIAVIGGGIFAYSFFVLPNQDLSSTSESTEQKRIPPTTNNQTQSANNDANQGLPIEIIDDISSSRQQAAPQIPPQNLVQTPTPQLIPEPSTPSPQRTTNYELVTYANAAGSIVRALLDDIYTLGDALLANATGTPSSKTAQRLNTYIDAYSTAHTDLLSIPGVPEQARELNTALADTYSTAAETIRGIQKSAASGNIDGAAFQKYNDAILVTLKRAVMIGDMLKANAPELRPGMPGWIFIDFAG